MKVANITLQFDADKFHAELTRLIEQDNDEELRAFTGCIGSHIALMIRLEKAEMFTGGVLEPCGALGASVEISEVN